jgi:hypothetical protein
MGGYFGPEAMFMLSLEPDQRDYFTDAMEEALKMRAEGLTDDEISGRLAHAILTVEGWTKTPRIVRQILLGKIENGQALS